MKMNWREFLKPDWRKIVLAVIIFLVLPALMYLPVLCIFGECPPHLIFLPFAGLMLVWGRPSLLIRENIIICIALVIISYLLSCILIFTYDRYRGKNEKRI